MPLASAALPCPEMVTALELLEREEQSVRISSSCGELDRALEGGIPRGMITELYGEAGVGKTQLCFQLSVNACTPAMFGGAEGKTIFIDTEGSFSIKRVTQIAKAVVDQLSSMSINSDEAKPPVLSIQNILSSILHMRCYDHIELLSAVHQLSQIINSNPAVCLVIIDSVAFHFRHEFESVEQRFKALNSLVLALLNVALKNKLSVVVTNQMTTRFDESGHGYLAPALGESWGYNCANQIFLNRVAAGGTSRIAQIVKSSYLPQSEVVFDILADGIRDVTDG